jgi:hypothetical protein
MSHVVPTYCEFGKETAELPLLLNYTPLREDIWEGGGIASPFLISALVGGERSFLWPSRFTPGDRTFGTH